MKYLYNVFAFLLVCFALPAAHAQTVSPVISEYIDSAEGSFQVRNEGLVPLNVILEVRSFTVNSEGDPLYRPQDAGLKVDLSAKSFRVLPHRPYAVFYRAHADHLPAWFTIYVSMQSGKPSASGLNLIIRLPHTVYLLTRSSVSRSEVLVSQSRFDPLAHKVNFTVVNRSASFDRAQFIELKSASLKKSFPGFPSFPGQSRNITLDWDSPFPPNQVEIGFSRFKLQSPFSAGP